MKALPALTAAACAALLAAAAPSRQEPAQVDATRAALEKWVETRRLISEERRDWELGRELLESRLGMVQRETDALRGRIAETEAALAAADAQRAGLEAGNGRLKDAAAGLAGSIEALERRTLELLRRAPAPIRERVKPLSQAIPDPADADKPSLGKRWQNVIGVLNELNKFQREILLTSEVRELRPGVSAEVTALYLGLGQAWYVSADGAAAGVGAPGPDSWTWTPANEAAPEIARAIAILKNEQAAGFVRLPLRFE